MRSRVVDYSVPRGALPRGFGQRHDAGSVRHEDTAVQEHAVIAHWHPGGETHHSTQVIRRHGHTPVIGAWEAGTPGTVADIAEGVRTGLDLVRRLWLTEGDDLRHRIDAIRAAASREDTTLIPLAVDALCASGWLG